MKKKKKMVERQIVKKSIFLDYLLSMAYQPFCKKINSVICLTLESFRTVY